MNAIELLIKGLEYQILIAKTQKSGHLADFYNLIGNNSLKKAEQWEEIINILENTIINVKRVNNE